MTHKLVKAAPTMIIALSFISSIVCGLDGDTRRAIYWLAAAVLNASMTF